LSNGLDDGVVELPLFFLARGCCKCRLGELENRFWHMKKQGLARFSTSRWGMAPPYNIVSG
ncbi:MAG: hypothetical protein ABW105_02800, partial [Candidatus Thiodiazotropha sp. 6PLUC1]